MDADDHMEKANKIASLLFKLVQHYLPDESYHQHHANRQRQEVFNYCMRIMGSSMQPSIVSDEFHIAELINKKLVREGRTEDAVRFSDRFRQLCSSKALTHKWSLLYLLLTISEGNRSQTVETPFAAISLKNLDIYTTKTHSKSKSLARPMEEDYVEDDFQQKIKGNKMHAKRASKAVSSQQGKYMEVDEETDDLTKRYSASAAQSAFESFKKYENTTYEVSEFVLLRDVIFAFQGIEGKFIKFDPSIDAYAVDPTIGVPRATRDLISKLCELGWLFGKVKRFVDSTLSQASVGLVSQSFCAAMNAELMDYYRLVAVLEAQIKSQSIEDSSKVSMQLTLRRLVVWTQDPLQKLKMLAILTDGCKGHKGGALASVVHSYVQHGDPFIRSLVTKIMRELSRPIFTMIERWMFEGELEDPFQEYFVASDPEVSIERLWHNKFTLRQEMLPSFISPDLAKQILLIGKSINFIRQCCKDSEWIVDPNVIAQAAASAAGKYSISDNNNNYSINLEYGQIGMLKAVVEKAAEVTNKRLMELLFGKYKIQQHCNAIKRYILLGQGDFIQYLMDHLAADLNNAASTIYRHDLLSVLEGAVRASDAQYDDPEILDCLDVRMREVAQGTSGWDVFSLDYRVGSPIDTIFTREAMNIYQNIFHFLWVLKRIETSMNATWATHMTLSHMLLRNRDERISALLHRCNVIRHEILHFIGNFQYYLMFEVMELSWQELVQAMEHARQEGNLDQLIEAHQRYLNNILEKALLKDDKDGFGSRAGEEKQLRIQLHKMFNLMLEFRKMQDNIFRNIDLEIHRRNEKDQMIKEGIIMDSDELNDDDRGMKRRRKQPGFGEQPGLDIQFHRAQLESLHNDYQALFDGFMQLLPDGNNGGVGAESESITARYAASAASQAKHQPKQELNDMLRFLKFRLDFNEHYKDKKKKQQQQQRSFTQQQSQQQQQFILQQQQQQQQQQQRHNLVL